MKWLVPCPCKADSWDALKTIIFSTVDILGGVELVPMHHDELSS